MREVLLPDEQILTPDSYIKNCLIHTREGEEYFLYIDPQTQRVVVRLDGYAIIPREDYERLLAKAGEERMLCPGQTLDIGEHP